MNYTKEQTEYITKKYEENPSRDTVKELAKELKKSEKSIIGKLAKEGVYRRESYLSKTGEKPITKDELVAQLEEVLEIDLQGLQKSPKLTLKALVDRIHREFGEV